MTKFYRLSHHLKYSFNQLDLPNKYDADSDKSIYKLTANNYQTFDLEIKELEIRPSIKKTDFLQAAYQYTLQILQKH